jgi:GNAT superfamily N-acetyltransferase
MMPIAQPLVPKDWSIRAGTEPDLEAVMALIHELAEYEKAPHEVINTHGDLVQDWQKGWYQILVAVHSDGEILGMALYHKAYSTWKGKMLYLDDLVVKAPFRNKGIGKALLLALRNEARNQDVHLIKWQVLDWNEPAVHMYERLGVQFDKGWWNCKWTDNP